MPIFPFNPCQRADRNAPLFRFTEPRADFNLRVEDICGMASLVGQHDRARKEHTHVEEGGGEALAPCP